MRGALATMIGVMKPHMDDYTNSHPIVGQKSMIFRREKNCVFYPQKARSSYKISYFLKSLRTMELSIKFLKISCFGREFCPTFDNLMFEEWCQNAQF